MVELREVYTPQVTAEVVGIMNSKNNLRDKRSEGLYHQSQTCDILMWRSRQLPLV